MKLGIIGTGMIVNMFAYTYDQLSFDKCVIWGRNIEKAKALAEKMNLDGYYDNLEEFFNSGIDTVYVALTNTLHFEYSKKALEYGLNCIIEKPITVNTKELKELKDLADSKGLIIIEATTVHYMDSIKTLKEKIETIKPIRLANFNYTQYSSRYDKFLEGEVLPTFDPKHAGGALMDLNIYPLNVIVALFGKPESVKCLSNIQKGIDTSDVITLEYSGFKVVSMAGKDSVGLNISYIEGEKGCIYTNDVVSTINNFNIKYRDHEEEWHGTQDPMLRMAYEFKEFIDIIDNKDYTRANIAYDISFTVIDILEKARLQNGIVFDADK